MLKKRFSGSAEVLLFYSDHNIISLKFYTSIAIKISVIDRVLNSDEGKHLFSHPQTFLIYLSIVGDQFVIESLSFLFQKG